MLSNNHLIAVPRYEEPRPKLLATPPEGDVHSWTLIPPAYTLSRSVEVLLSIGQTIHVVDSGESEDRGWLFQFAVVALFVPPLLS